MLVAVVVAVLMVVVVVTGGAATATGVSTISVMTAEGSLITEVMFETLKSKQSIIEIEKISLNFLLKLPVLLVLELIFKVEEIDSVSVVISFSSSSFRSSFKSSMLILFEFGLLFVSLFSLITDMELMETSSTFSSSCSIDLF